MSTLESKSFAANALLKGTAERAFKRIGDQKIVMDISKLRDVSDENSIFKYEVDLSVGGRDFNMRFRNNNQATKSTASGLGQR